MLMNTAPGGSGANASPAKFQHWRQQTDVIQQVSAFGGGVVNYTGGDLPEQFRRIQASADYFALFEAPITLGRSFSAEEDLPGGPKVVLISEEIWERRFGSEPDILGTTIDLSSEPHVVIGVIGEGFTTEFGPQADVWVPFQLDPNTSDQGHFFSVAARLEPDVTLAQAQDRLGASAAAYREKFPGVLGENASFSVEPSRKSLSEIRARLCSFWPAQ